MSRLAKIPVTLGEGVSLTQQGDTVTVKGAKHTLTSHIPAGLVKLTQNAGAVAIAPVSAAPAAKAAAGLVRNLIANLAHGVTEDFVKELEFTGVGYRVAAEGRKLTLNVGYSHPVVLEAPEGISLAVQKNVIKVSGPNLQAVGQFAANVRAVRPPEPYKGKGIAYRGEQIRRKAGKTAKAAE